MVERYKPYRSGQVTLPGIKSLDPAIQRETVKLSQSISNTANQIANFAFKRYEKQAVEQAKKAGIQDVQGTLDKFSNRVPKSSADIAQFETAVNVSAGNLEIKTLKEMNKKIQDAEMTNMNPVDLGKELDAIVTGSADALAKIDPISGQNLNFALSKEANRRFFSYSNSYAKLEQEKLAITAIENAETKIQLLEQGANTLVAAEVFDSNLKTEIQAFKDYLTANKVSSSKIATLSLTLADRVHTSRIRAEFNKSTDKRRYLNKFINDVGTISRGVSGDSKKALRSEMQSEINRLDTEHNSLITTLSGEVKSLGKTLGSGFSIGTGLEDIKRLVEPLPNNDKKIDLMNDINALEIMQPTLENFRSKSVPEMKRIIADLYNELDDSESVSNLQRELFEDLEKIAKDKKARVEPIKTEINNIIDLIKENKDVAPAVINEVKGRIDNLNSPVLDTKFTNLLTLISSVDTIEALPLPAAREFVESIKSNESKYGTEIETAKYIDILTNVLQQKEKMLKEDPVQFYANASQTIIKKSTNTVGKDVALGVDGTQQEYIIEKPVINNFPNIDMDSVLNFRLSEENQKIVKQEINKRITYMDSVKEGNGQINDTTFYLTKSEASSLMDALNTGDNTQDTVLLQHINNMFGDKSAQVWQQLFKGDQSKAQLYAHLGLLSRTNPELTNKVLTGLDFIEQKTFSFDSGEKILFEKYANNFLNRMGLEATRESAIIQAVKGAYIFDAKTQGESAVGTTMNEKKFGRILNEILGGTDTTGGVVEYNDVNVILPPGFQRDGLDSLMGKLTFQEFYVSSTDTSGNMSRPSFQEPDGSFTPIPEDVYDSDYKDEMRLRPLYPHKGIYYLDLGSEDTTLFAEDGSLLLFDITRAAETRDSNIDRMKTLKKVRRDEKAAIKLQKLMEKRIMTNYTITTPLAKGKPIIQAAVDIVADIMPGANIEDTKLQMMEIASAESVFATHKGTFSSYSTGPFQFDDGPETAFATIQNRIKNEPNGNIAKNAQKMEDAINAKFPKLKLKITDLKWDDMNKPLHSAIMLRLFMAMSPEPIGSTVEERAAWWKTNWNTEAGKGTIDHYIEEAKANL